MALPLESATALVVRQRKELGEIVLGWESRNKYEITDANGSPLGFAAEQGKGILGTLFRQVLGHWRTFDIHIFDDMRQLALVAHHPFRFFFQRLEVMDAAGQLLGCVQQRFAFLRKRFDVLDANGQVIMSMSSPLFKLWTFPFFKGERQVAVIKKQWGGLLKEAFTDADTFGVELSTELSITEKTLVAAAALFVDLLYFEAKAN